MNNICNRIIAIRTDVNEVVATGQFMRCALVADILKSEYSIESIFISSDEETVPFARERGYECRVMHSDWRKPESEVERLVKLLNELGINELMADSYYIDESYVAKLGKNGIRTVIFDDLAEYTYPADMVINYGPGADVLNYNRRYEKYGTTLLLGADYIPLREQFSENYPDMVSSDRTENIFLTTGGGDSLGIASRIIDRIFKVERFSEYTIHLLAGRLFKADDIIKGWADNTNQFGRKSVVLHQNVQNVAQIMSRCSMAVTPAGTTLFELCACGVPSVSFVFADNQIPDAVFFDEKGYMEYAGDFRKRPDECMENIINGLIHIADIENVHTASYEEKRLSLIQLIDGKGAWRIASSIAKPMNNT